MFNAERVEVPDEVFMTPEEFQSIVRKNVSGVVFSHSITPEGTFVRRLDTLEDTHFNPFDPATYKLRERTKIQHYEIGINPNQETSRVELSFLRQISKVRSSMQPKLIFANEIIEYPQKEKEAIEVGIANFRAENPKLVSNTLNSFK